MASSLNPFEAFDEVPASERDYAEVFQNVNDETIDAVIDEWINIGKALRKRLFVQLKVRFQAGRTSQRIRSSDTRQIFDYHGEI